MQNVSTPVLGDDVQDFLGEFENDSVRNSTLATLVEVMIFPIHRLPGWRAASFIQTAMMRGGAPGRRVCGVGHAEGATTTLTGSRLRPLADVHPAPRSASTIANRRSIFMGGFAALVA
jgi:hypothetical protein